MDNAPVPVVPNRRRWRPLAIVGAVVLGATLFLTQCVDTACMTGVACIPVIKVPSWYEKSEAKRERAQYENSLNELQKAIYTENQAAIELAIHAHQDQVTSLYPDGVSMLGMAVKQENARTTALLLAAGADGFLTPSGNDFSPFMQALIHDVMRLSDENSGWNDRDTPGPSLWRSGKTTPESTALLIEPFLATRKLKAKSPEADEFLADAVRATLVFDRLLEYGVPLTVTPDLFEQMISAGNGFLVRRVLGSTVDLKALARTWSNEDQARVMSAAIRRCRFDVANILLDRGFVGLDPAEWAKEVRETCSGAQWFGGLEAKTYVLEDARDIFLARVANLGTH